MKIITLFKNYDQQPYLIGKTFYVTGPVLTNIGPSSTKEQMLKHHSAIRGLVLFAVTGLSILHFAAAYFFVDTALHPRVWTDKIGPQQVTIICGLLLIAALICYRGLTYLPPIVFLIKSLRSHDNE